MINQEQFTQYRNALNVSADLASAAIRLFVQKLAQSENGYDQDQLLQGYRAVLQRYGKMAAQVALEFYTSQREREGISDDFQPQEYTYAQTVQAGSDVARAWSSNDTQNVISNVIARRVRECADDTLMRNAYKDPRNPKWAIIAHAGACGWCRMLASNGFAYAKESRAQVSRHDNCKCAVVVEFSDHPALEGYDETRYRDQYTKVREQSVAEAKEIWANMSADERKAAARKGRGGYDRILRNRLTANMDAGRSHNKA